jgi:PAS domain S-box-containing protein
VIEKLNNWNKSSLRICIFFLFGAVGLSIISFIQKALVGFDPFLLESYLAPSVFGGISFSTIGIYLMRHRQAEQALRNTNEYLEEIVNARTKDLKIANEKSLQSEREMKSIFRAAPIGIGVVVNRVFREVNEYFCKITGYSRDELIGQNARIIYPTDEDYEYVGTKKYEEIKNTGIGAVDTRFKCKDGKIIDVLLSSTPLNTEDLSDGVTFTALDITERKQMEEALRRAHHELEIRVRERTSELAESNNALILYTEKLEKLNEELLDFAFAAAHDLQEPLRKIQTFCDMAIRGSTSTLDKKSKEYMDRVVDSATRMRQHLQDLLQFSRTAIKPGTVEEVDLNKTAWVAADLFEEDLKELNARVEIEGMPIIEAAEAQILQLFQNLISNALKFRRAENPLIRIRARQQGEQCEILVVDNGIGFEPQFAERIFKPFQRLHNRKDYEGTGMGLTTCRKIVEWHGGSIRAESVLGKGSTFIINLPVKHET